MKKCKLYFLEIHDFMKKIFTNIYKMLANHEEKSSSVQNFASLNKLIDKIKEC